MGKILFFVFLSSQLFLKELPRKENETAAINSSHIFVLADAPPRVCEFPTWKEGIFRDRLDPNNPLVDTMQNRLNDEREHFMEICVF